MNKQIEELAKALHESQHEFDKAWHECLQNKGKLPERENVFYAKYLIEKKGYRKASEVAREVIQEVRNAWANSWTESEFLELLKDIEKKYEVTEE